MPFLFTNIPKFYQFETFFTKNITFFGKLTTNFIRKGSKLKKKLKTQGKNSKLKEKTQGLGGTCPLRVPKWCLKKSLYTLFFTFILSQPSCIGYPCIGIIVKESNQLLHLLSNGIESLSKNFIKMPGSSQIASSKRSWLGSWDLVEKCSVKP